MPYCAVLGCGVVVLWRCGLSSSGDKSRYKAGAGVEGIPGARNR